jgi:hypothetical protein
MSRCVALSLFGFALCVYLLTAAGHIVSDDGTQMFNTTRSIVREGSFSIPWGQAMEGRGGKLYARYGVALSLAAVPFYLVGWGISSAGPAVARENAEFVQRFAVSMVNPVVGALWLVLVFALGRALGFSRRTSVALALACGFCTFAWAGAKYFVSEPLQGVFMTAALLVLVGRRGMEGRALALSGAFLGLGFLTKPATAMAYPVLAAIIAWGPGRPRSASTALRRLVLFSVPFGALCLVSAGYNYYRFGNPLEFGFGYQDPRNRAFSTPLAVGLYGLLFSSGKSVFLYAPPAALFAFSIGGLFRRRPAAAAACALVPAVFIVFYAKWVAWHGEGFWGPRYLLPVVPFLMVPVGTLLDRGASRRRLKLGAFIAACALGLLVQVGGVTVSYASYFREVGAYPYKRPFYDPRFMEEVHFRPSMSPVIGHWRILTRIVRGEGGWSKIPLGGPAIQSRVPVGEEEAQAFREGLDIWYVHFYRAGVPAGYFVWVPLVLAAGAIACGLGIRRCTRAEGGAGIGV